MPGEAVRAGKHGNLGKGVKSLVDGAGLPAGGARLAGSAPTHWIDQAGTCGSAAR